MTTRLLTPEIKSVQYNASETILEKNGYTINKGIFTITEIDHICDLLNLERLVTLCPDNNIFRQSEDNRIKQIQHLEKIEEFLSVGKKLQEIFNLEGDIVNMQLFIKYPGCPGTKQHQDGAYLSQKSSNKF